MCACEPTDRLVCACTSDVLRRLAEEEEGNLSVYGYVLWVLYVHAVDGSTFNMLLKVAVWLAVSVTSVCVCLWDKCLASLLVESATEKEEAMSIPQHGQRDYPFPEEAIPKFPSSPPDHSNLSPKWQRWEEKQSSVLTKTKPTQFRCRVSKKMF